MIKYEFIYGLLFMNIMILNNSAQENKAVLYNDNCIYENNEKVFVHLPKFVFVSGEILNYKAYIVNASSFYPKSPSKVLYFDIVDYNNKQIMNWRANITDNIVMGSISLSDTISGGFYKIRAYTNWMKNASPDLYYSTYIVITKITDKKLNNLNISIPANSNNNIIDFFPEGGNLIEGINTEVAYIINSKYSVNKSVPGCIKDDQLNIIDSIDNGYVNFGTFNIKPEGGKSYVAEFILKTGEIISANLPVIKKSGHSLMVEDYQDTHLIFTIQTNVNKEINLNSLRLIISSHGLILNDTNIFVHKGIGQISILKKSLPNGIIEAILFDASDLPVAKRLYYLPAENTLSLKVKNQKNTYQKREKVEIEIEVNDLPLDKTANLSVSVSDERSLIRGLSANNNIIPYLYLNSDLTQQNNLFNIIDSLSYRQINDLLIAIQPENYAWNYSSGNSSHTCNYISENKGFVLSGKILYQNSGLPVKNGLITLATIDSICMVDYCNTDTTGFFYFLLNEIHDNKTLILQFENDTSYEDKILWDLRGSNINEYNINNMPLDIEDKMQEYLAHCRKIRLINSIYQNIPFNGIIQSEITSQKQSKNNFFGNPDYIVYPSDYVELADFKEIADNILPGIMFKKKKQKYYLQVYDYNNSMFLENEGSFFLNGVPFHDLQYIASLGSEDIKYIEVITSKFFYGNITFYGIVSIYTYDGKIPDSYLDNSVFLFKMKLWSQIIIMHNNYLFL